MKDTLCIRKNHQFCFCWFTKNEIKATQSPLALSIMVCSMTTLIKTEAKEIQCFENDREGTSIIVKDKMCYNNIDETRKCFPIWPLKFREVTVLLC